MIVNIPSNTEIVTADAVYQWDYGQKLQITGLPISACQIHFCDKTCKETIVRMGVLVNANTIEASIPDRLLENEYPINAFIYALGDNSGQTIAQIQIPIIKRKRPEDYIDPVPPTEQTQIEELISSANLAINELQNKFNQSMTYGELNELIDEKLADLDMSNSELGESTIETMETLNALLPEIYRCVPLADYHNIALKVSTGTEFEKIGAVLGNGDYEIVIKVDFAPIKHIPLVFRGHKTVDTEVYSIFTSDVVGTNKKVSTATKQFQLFVEHYEETDITIGYQVYDKVKLQDTLGTRYGGTIIQAYRIERGK